MKDDLETSLKQFGDFTAELACKLERLLSLAHFAGQVADMADGDALTTVVVSYC